MGKYKDMPGIRILEETMRIAVGNGKRALLFLLTRPLGHEAFSYDMREKNDWLKPGGFGQSDFLS